MKEDVDEKFDSMLRTHLRRELDPHVGSAMLKFDAEHRLLLRPSSGRGGGWQSHVRFAAAAVVMLGIGVAASMLYRNMTPSGSNPIAMPNPAGKQNIPFTEAVQSSWTQTYDGGTVMIDPQTPARMLRRVQYEKTEWKDQDGKWQSRIDIPQEDVILVDMPKQ